MNRPKILHVGGTLYWVIRTVNPDTQVLKDADSTPTVAVRKNGASVGDSVTVTKRSATTGIYDCSYNPAGEVEGDEFTIEESATVTGTTTGSATYANSWEFSVIAVERGTDSAATSAQAVDIQSRIPATLDGGNMRSSVQNTTAIADAVWAKDISGATAGTAGGYLKDIWGRITAAVYTMWTNLIAMITGTGATAQWTAKALELGPSGDVTVVAAPIGAEDVERVVGSSIRAYTGEKGTVTVTIRDANEALVDLTGKTLRMVFSINGNVVYRIAHGDLVVSGSTVTFSKNLAITGGEGEVNWSLFEVDKDALAHGVMYVSKIPY